MLKKSIIIIITVLCLCVFFTGCTRTTIQSEKKNELTVLNWGSGLGDGILSYSIYLTNESNKTFFIKSIQPFINETIKNKILSKEMVVLVNKDIKPNKSLHITGEIMIDTKSLTTSDMTNLKPFITDIKVITEQKIIAEQIIKLK
jgi:hypothetical protein